MEKRKDKRVECFVPVDGKKGSAFEVSKTIDLSKNGIGFISDKKIPINKEIAIELDMAENEEPVLVIGQVRWVSRIPDTKQYRIGLFFKDVVSGSKSRIKKYTETV